MINYKTKDVGMTYNYNGKEYKFEHDLFVLWDFDIQGQYVNMVIQNMKGEYSVTPFYDTNIQLKTPMVLKVAYVMLDDNNMRVHGYEECSDANAYNVIVASLPQRTMKLVDKQKVDVPYIQGKIQELINNIEDEDLNKLVSILYSKYWSKLSTYPAATNVHHNIPNGLVLHLYNVTKQALDIAKNYTDINKDLVAAGALLHDLGKIIEYNEDGSISDIGIYEDHISIGFSLIQSEAKSLGIDDNILNRLLHVILSHHGKLEWGSPKLPGTKEAFIVHMADYIDTNMYILHESYRKVSCGGKDFNKYMGTNIVNENIEVSSNYDININ